MIRCSKLVKLSKSIKYIFVFAICILKFRRVLTFMPYTVINIFYCRQHINKYSQSSRNFALCKNENLIQQTVSYYVPICYIKPIFLSCFSLFSHRHTENPQILMIFLAKVVINIKTKLTRALLNCNSVKIVFSTKSTY